MSKSHNTTRKGVQLSITSSGLRVPDALRGFTHGSNLEKDKRYDQILYYPKFTKCFTNRAGVLDFYEGGIDKLLPNAKLSKLEFTFELSDHMPLWIHIDTDTDAERIDQILVAKKPQQKVPAGFRLRFRLLQCRHEVCNCRLRRGWH